MDKYNPGFYRVEIRYATHEEVEAESIEDAETLGRTNFQRMNPRIDIERVEFDAYFIGGNEEE